MKPSRTGDALAASQRAILALLLALAAAAWGWLVLLAEHASGPGADMAAMHTPSMGLRAPLFLAVWVAMMVAMMFPAAAPMILAFHKVQAGRRQRREAAVPTAVFVAGYMLVWTLAGAAAYAAALAAEAVAARLELPPTAAARIGGGVLAAAGLY